MDQAYKANETEHR